MGDLTLPSPGLATAHRLNYGLHRSEERARKIVASVPELDRTPVIEYAINNGDGMMTRVVVDVEAFALACGKRYHHLGGGFDVDWHKVRAAIVHDIACNLHNYDVLEPLDG